jgi:hypothetical protein
MPLSGSARIPTKCFLLAFSLPFPGLLVNPSNLLKLEPAKGEEDGAEEGKDEATEEAGAAETADESKDKATQDLGAAETRDETKDETTEEARAADTEDEPKHETTEEAGAAEIGDETKDEAREEVGAAETRDGTKDEGTEEAGAAGTVDAVRPQTPHKPQWKTLHMNPVEDLVEDAAHESSRAMDEAEVAEPRLELGEEAAAAEASEKVVESDTAVNEATVRRAVLVNADEPASAVIDPGT